MTEQQPDALMSYTRFDDQRNSAALTTFREKLSDEVSGYIGQPFHIFQDIEDIKWGQQFEQRIDHALATITFFIPILTPSFFKSDFCRYELERFLQREAHLGRRDLVLPVYFIRVHALENQALCRDDRLAQIIAARQYIDWRDLRFERFDSPKVRRMLAKMAEQIADALDERVILESFPPVPSHAASEGVAIAHVESQSVEQQPIVSQPVVPAYDKPQPDAPPRPTPKDAATVHDETQLATPPAKPKERPLPRDENQTATPPRADPRTRPATASAPTRPKRSNTALISVTVLALVIASAFLVSRIWPVWGTNTVAVSIGTTGQVLEMVKVPAGPFLIGSSDEDPLASNDEKPQHEVTLDTYWIGKTEVTNAQLRPFVKGDGYSNPDYWTEAGWQWRMEEGITQPRFWDDPEQNGDNYPVVGISWFEAVAYANWLSAQTGYVLRLPIEAEWEKAARGSDGLIWPWGNEWMVENCNCANSVGKTTLVGQYPDGASPYGALDMAGNALEWTATAWLKDYPYQVTDEWTDAYLAGHTVRALRGGYFEYFEYGPETIRGSDRLGSASADRYNSFGLRVASDSPPASSDE